MYLSLTNIVSKFSFAHTYLGIISISRNPYADGFLVAGIQFSGTDVSGPVSRLQARILF